MVFTSSSPATSSTTELNPASAARVIAGSNAPSVLNARAASSLICSSFAAKLAWAAASHRPYPGGQLPPAGHGRQREGVLLDRRCRFAGTAPVSP
jgi:hypothetical protein